MTSKVVAAAAVVAAALLLAACQGGTLSSVPVAAGSDIHIPPFAKKPYEAFSREAA